MDSYINIPLFQKWNISLLAFKSNQLPKELAIFQKILVSFEFYSI